MYSKCLKFIVGLTLAVVPPSHQFSTSTSSSRHAPSLYATRDLNNNDRATVPPADAIRNIAAASAIAVGLLFPTTSIAAQEDTAYQPQLLNNVESSSLQLSVEITTMDFSMPSSYDSIADPVASGKDELTETTVIASGGSSKKKAAPKKKAPKEKAATKSFASKEEAAAAQ